MNQHPANTVFRAIKAMAAPVERSACSNHRRDTEGFPLGNCIECAAYRKQMDAWYMEQVMAGEHKPGADVLDHDRQASGFEDYSSNRKQSST